MGNKQSSTLPEMRAARLRESLKSTKVSSIDSSPTYASRASTDLTGKGRENPLSTHKEPYKANQHHAKKKIASGKLNGDSHLVDEAHTNGDARRKRKVVKKKRPSANESGDAASAAANTATRTTHAVSGTPANQTHSASGIPLHENTAKRRVSKRTLNMLPVARTGTNFSAHSSHASPDSLQRGVPSTAGGALPVALMMNKLPAPALAQPDNALQSNAPSRVLWPQSEMNVKNGANTHKTTHNDKLDASSTARWASNASGLTGKAPAALVQISLLSNNNDSNISNAAESISTISTTDNEALTTSKAMRKTRRRTMARAPGERAASGSNGDPDGARVNGFEDEECVSIVLDQSARQRSSSVRKKMKRRTGSVISNSNPHNNNDNDGDNTNKNNSSNNNTAAAAQNGEETPQTVVVGQPMVSRKARRKSGNFSRKYSIFSFYNALHNISDDDEDEDGPTKSGNGVSPQGAATDSNNDKNKDRDYHADTCTDIDTSTGLKRMNDLDLSEWKSAARRLSKDSNAAEVAQAQKEGAHAEKHRRKSFKKKSFTRRGSIKNSKNIDQGEKSEIEKSGLFSKYSFAWPSMRYTHLLSSESSIAATDNISSNHESSNEGAAERERRSTLTKRKLKGGLMKKKARSHSLTEAAAAAASVGSQNEAAAGQSTYDLASETVTMYLERSRADTAHSPTIVGDNYTISPSLEHAPDNAGPVTIAPSKSRLWQGDSFYMNDDILSKMDSHSNCSDESQEDSTLKKGYSMFASAARSFVAHVKSIRHNHRSFTREPSGKAAAATEKEDHYSIAGGSFVMGDDDKSNSPNKFLASITSSKYNFVSKPSAEQSPAVYSIMPESSETYSPSSHALMAGSPTAAAVGITTNHNIQPIEPAMTHTNNAMKLPYPMTPQQQQQYYYQMKQKEYMMQVQNQYRVGPGQALGYAHARAPGTAMTPGGANKACAYNGMFGGPKTVGMHAHQQQQMQHHHAAQMSGAHSHHAAAIASQEAYCRARGYKGKIPQPQPFLEGPRLQYKPRIDYAKVFDYTMESERMVLSPLQQPKKQKGFFETIFSSGH